jgi:hypothetical protein
MQCPRCGLLSLDTACGVTAAMTSGQARCAARRRGACRPRDSDLSLRQRPLRGGRWACSWRGFARISLPLSRGPSKRVSLAGFSAAEQSQKPRPLRMTPASSCSLLFRYSSSSALQWPFAFGWPALIEIYLPSVASLRRIRLGGLPAHFRAVSKSRATLSSHERVVAFERCRLEGRNPSRGGKEASGSPGSWSVSLREISLSMRAYASGRSTLKPVQ